MKKACKSLALGPTTGRALHNEMRVDDASAEDYACPSIFKNDIMKMRFPSVHFWGKLFSFIP